MPGAQGKEEKNDQSYVMVVLVIEMLLQLIVLLPRPGAIAALPLRQERRRSERERERERERESRGTKDEPGSRAPWYSCQCAWPPGDPSAAPWSCPFYCSRSTCRETRRKGETPQSAIFFFLLFFFWPCNLNLEILVKLGGGKEESY